MIYFKRLSEQILNFVLGVILCFSFVLAITDSLQFKFSSFFLLVIIILSMVLCFFSLKSKVTTRITLCSIGILSIGAIIFLLVKDLLNTFIYNFGVFACWVVDYVQGLGTYEKTYSIFLTIAISLGVSVFVHLFTIRYFNFLILLIAGCSLFISQWINDFFTSYLSLYVFLFIIIIFYFRHIYLKNYSKGPNSFVSITVFTAWIVPISAFILLLSFSLPPKPKPMEWKWLDHKINGAFNYFNKSFFSYKTPDYFSISNSGFGDTGILGGKVKLNKTVVLRVNSPRIVYLKGSSKDFYSGLAWRNTLKTSLSLKDPGSNLNQNSKELVYGIGKYSNSASEKLYYNDTLKITFVNFKSKSLFVTAFTNRINFQQNKSPRAFVNTDGTLTSSKVLSKNFSYTIDTLSPKYDNENFIKYLRESEHENVTQDNKLYGKYLQIPASLPLRVKSLTSSITSSKSTDYDKVKAIEQYLSSNYPYTLKPKSTPNNRDFVDYFLFDLKEGYCTYFATAMTVMSRCICLPARYVEGYVLPPTAKRDNTFEVTNEQAHAWVEVHFQGVGWIPFEPTAPFRDVLYNSKDFNSSKSGSTANNSSSLDYMEVMKRYHADGQLPAGTDLGNLDVSKKADNISLIILVLIALLLVFSLICLIAVNRIKIKLRFGKIYNLEPRASIIEYYLYYLRTLGLIDMSIRPGETPGQYSERIDMYLGLNLKNNFSEVTEKFLISRYSQNNVSLCDKQVVADFNPYLHSKVKKEINKFKFFVLKYLLGKF